MTQHVFKNSEEWAEQVFYPWLRSHNWHIDQLITWLESDKVYEGPVPFIENQEPYLLLSVLIKRKTHKHIMRLQFQNRLASLLLLVADGELPGKNKRKVLYNLFQLCKELPSPEFYGNAFAYILEKKTFRAQYLGKDLRELCLYAVAKNQKDQSLLPDWERMLYKHKSAFIRSDDTVMTELGMIGILNLPAEPIEAWLGAIGKAVEFRLPKLGDNGGVRDILHAYQFFDAPTYRPCSFYKHLLDFAWLRKWDERFLLELQRLHKEQNQSADGVGAAQDFTT